MFPYKYYFPLLVAFIVWASVQYTGGWEDYVMLAFCTALGLLAKHFKFSRPSLLIGFILAERVEALSLQVSAIYTVEKLIERPIFITLCLCILGLFLFTLFRKNKVNYA